MLVFGSFEPYYKVIVMFCLYNVSKNLLFCKANLKRSFFFQRVKEYSHSISCFRALKFPSVANKL